MCHQPTNLPSYLPWSLQISMDSWLLLPTAHKSEIDLHGSNASGTTQGEPRISFGRQLRTWAGIAKRLFLQHPLLHLLHLLHLLLRIRTRVSTVKRHRFVKRNMRVNGRLNRLPASWPGQLIWCGWWPEQTIVGRGLYFSLLLRNFKSTATVVVSVRCTFSTATLRSAVHQSAMTAQQADTHLSGDQQLRRETRWCRSADNRIKFVYNMNGIAMSYLGGGWCCKKTSRIALSSLAEWPIDFEFNATTTHLISQEEEVARDWYNWCLLLPPFDWRLSRNLLWFKDWWWP